MTGAKPPEAHSHSRFVAIRARGTLGFCATPYQASYDRQPYVVRHLAGRDHSRGYFWRVVPGHRVQPATTGVVEFAARAVQYFLYALLCVQATLGFVLRWSGNEAMSLFGLQIPPFFPPFSKSGHHLAADVHNYVGWAIIILAAGHAAAALFHHFYLRDGVLWRMLPGPQAKSREAQASSRK
jgi:hypothetical protein